MVVVGLQQKAAIAYRNNSLHFLEAFLHGYDLAVI